MVYVFCRANAGLNNELCML